MIRLKGTNTIIVTDNNGTKFKGTIEDDYFWFSHNQPIVCDYLFNNIGINKDDKEEIREFYLSIGIDEDDIYLGGTFPEICNIRLYLHQLINAFNKNIINISDL